MGCRRPFYFSFLLAYLLQQTVNAQNDDAETPGPEQARQNRRFENCSCIQRVRTTYITTDICGKAALCNWEIWNYKYLKLKARHIRFYDLITEGENYIDEDCDLFWVQMYTCLIGYPKPLLPNELCYKAYDKCNEELSQMLYADCDPIRKERGLPKPEDVNWNIDTSRMNFALIQDSKTIFKPRPSSEKPTHNGYYALSCPVLYQFPYFTINLLLRSFDPTVEYDDTNALKAVAEILPKFVRDGVNKERILNFAALSIDESMINWCGIPRNYICVKEESDPDSDVCSDTKLTPWRDKCLSRRRKGKEYTETTVKPES